MKFWSGIFGAFFCFSASDAQAQLVPPDQCAIIVASRPSMGEALSYMSANPTLDVQEIFASSNGWLALSVGFIPNFQSGREIAGMVSRGQIPSDSYCSTGEMYQTQVWAKSRYTTPPTTASYPTDPFASFDARPLTLGEKRFLQAGLVFNGLYTGLIDGRWGNSTQSAFEAYSAREGWPDTNGSAAILALEALAKLDSENWQAVWLSQFDVSFQMPTRLMRQVHNAPSLAEFEAFNESVFLTVKVGNVGQTVAAHDTAVSLHAGSAAPYLLRNNSRWVSSVTSSEVNIYVHSRPSASNQWITFQLIWSKDHFSGTAELLLSSYQSGRADELDYPIEGHLNGLIMALEQELPPPDPQPVVQAPDAAASAPRASVPEQVTSGTGTGFLVNAEGAVMTNSHVVNGCGSLLVDGRPAYLIAESESFDLAILKLEEEDAERSYLSFAQDPARLNADVTVSGYPLHYYLGGLNITRGSVTSIEGMRGDTMRMQISAPVQPGNSGGPIVNARGEVVGIVVSKLDATRIAEATGDIPQNVNFGIRGELGKLFASIHGVNLPFVEVADIPLPEDLADTLRAATVLIECR